jgi:hypothetical protein
MPPFLMLIGVAFVVIMVMMGENPIEKMREEQKKYGRDPLAREINKLNEKRAKKGTGMVQYKPPPGSLTMRVPPEEAQLHPAPRRILQPGEEEMVVPAPDIPIEQWGSQYPSYMYAPQQGGSSMGGTLGPGTVRSPRGGTSIVPGR